MSFQQSIIGWYNLNKRDLPWRNTNDAYVIWLSEIILQQTRVAQGMPYFHQFLKRFPTVQTFAQATEMEVLKLWQGLGYYSRGRNMLITAKLVAEKFGGVFPTGYKELITLKGIGSYTAAAIASFSSGESIPVVDGNVYRVLARYFGINTPIDTAVGKNEFFQLAKQLITDYDPAIFNQAMMEFGALLCKPANPNCMECPVAVGCLARQEKLIKILPVKKNKIIKKQRFFNYFIIEENESIVFKERKKGDIWQGLYEFPLLEFNEELQDQENMATALGELLGGRFKFVKMKTVKHQLTHQTISANFFKVVEISGKLKLNKEFKKIAINNILDLPVPVIIHDFLNNYKKEVY